MEDLEMIVNRNHVKLAAAVIQEAYEELQTDKSISASTFFGSDWFTYLCAITRVDYLMIRRSAYELPGFVPRSARREARMISREKAIRLGRRRKRRGPKPTKLMAYPPNGEEPFHVNGYGNAAAIIGCSAAAVQKATADGRECFGWRFEKR